MNTISTGEPATLKTYLEIAKVFGPKAEKFIQDKIDNTWTIDLEDSSNRIDEKHQYWLCTPAEFEGNE